MSIKLNPPQIEVSLPPLIARYYLENNEWAEGSDEIRQEYDNKINELYEKWTNKEISMSEFYRAKREVTQYYENLISGYTLTLPLYSNPSVSEKDFDQIAIVIKTVSTGETKEIIKVDLDSNITFNSMITITNFLATYVIGQYYKLQMAYVKNDIIGHYSSVGILKCTAQPTATIEDLKPKQLNNAPYSFTGVYQSERDVSEKVYSYSFVIKDAKGIYDTSGTLLHNVNNDIDTASSTDEWIPNKMLKDHARYGITYKVTTINGVEVSSPEYIITVGQDGYINDENGFLIAALDQDSGCVDLYFKKSNGDTSLMQAGDYIVTRTSDKDNFNHWTQLTKIIISNDLQNPKFFTDYTVEQGVTYQYGLQLVKPSGWLTARQEAIHYLNLDDATYHRNPQKKLLVDFEDAYLFDGERQLCIKYNPKVSSFKNTLLESKMDTLGGKHPFIFRNGNVNYKEFSISGLISMLMDENGSFAATRFKDQDNEAPDYIGASGRINLTGDNFYQERQFKLEVLDWLTNGQPKLFRSPGEGNYIIRAMNTSLSPNDTLGRMLHTFTCTAYEIADFTMANLYKYKFIPDEMRVGKDKIMIFGEKLLRDVSDDNGYILLSSGNYHFVRFENQYLPCNVFIQFKNGDGDMFNIGNSTGVYEIKGLGDNTVTSVQVRGDYYSAIEPTAKIIYGYYGKSPNLTHTDTYKAQAKTVVQQYTNFMAESKTIVDVNNTMNYCYLIKLTPKPVIDVIIKDGEFYYASLGPNNETIVSDEKISATPFTIFRLLNPQDYTNYQYVCGKDNFKYYFNEINYNVNINNSITSLLPYNTQQLTYSLLQSNDALYLADNGQTYLATKNYEKVLEQTFKTGARFMSLKNVGRLQELSIGNGVICEIVYETLEEVR